MRRNIHRILGCLLGCFLLFQTSEAQPQTARTGENVKAQHQQISQAQREARLVSLSIVVNKAEIAVGERVLLKVTGKYSDTTETEITTGIMWESSDRAVAQMNSKGELEGIRPGKVEIKASYSGLSSAAYTFIVKEGDQAKADPAARELHRREVIPNRLPPREPLSPQAPLRGEEVTPNRAAPQDLRRQEVIPNRVSPKETPKQGGENVVGRAPEVNSEKKEAAREQPRQELIPKRLPPKKPIRPQEPIRPREAIPNRLSPTEEPISGSVKPTVRKTFDDVVKEMDWGNIAFNTPSKMNLRDKATIQLVLSLTHGIDELSHMITAKGEKDNARIKVSDRMEADLSGFDFEIIPITPKEQAISHVDATSWSWRVRPKSKGLHQLHLTLTAKFDLNGTQTQKSIRTFERTITVEVTTTEMLTEFVADNWLWVWAPFALPVGVWVWKKRRPSPELKLLGGIFISYRREDSAGHAQAIYARLAQHTPKDRIFMDVDAIKPGVDFPRVLQRAVTECDIMIAVIGKRWGGIEGQTGRRIDDPKDFVRLEVSSALARGIPVIPVLVEGATMPPENTLPDDLKKLNERQWIELSNTRFTYDLGRLVDAVRDIAKPEATADGERRVRA
jgi:hypothetical protein